MLMDADFEAPGITWLLQERLPDPPISFADILAIVHGDPSDSGKDSLDLIADRLIGSSFDNCVFVPAFRSTSGLQTLDIRPEHICSARRDPFFLSNFIAALALRLGVELVVVDLRAGFSELAAGLLLDPRLYRVFVTTLAGQSLDGTKLLMEYLGARASSTTETDPYPAMVISQVPEGIDGDILSSRIEDLRGAWQRFVPRGQPDSEPVTLLLGFDKSLQALPADWTRITSALRQSEAYQKAGMLEDWLPFRNIPKPGPVPVDSLPARRNRVAQEAEHRIFAEKGATEGFLYTPALRALAEDHLASLPVTVVVGAKGSGKTLAFRELARLGKWERFTSAVTGRPSTGAYIVPVLFPSALEGTPLNQILSVSFETARALGGIQPCLQTDLTDHLRTCLAKFSNQSEWRDTWLDIIAWSAGYAVGKIGIGREFIKHITAIELSMVAIFDGLEDNFQAIASDAKMQMAIRALVQDVPQWLSQVPGRPVGLIVFVRRDLVESAVTQNSAQLLDRYKPYALNWNRTEALRLTYWLLWRAGAVVEPGADFMRLGEEEVSALLVPAWGKKLGQDDSREARTATWVLDALSDYNGQVQARDLVRFIAFAASRSEKDEKWLDRLLIPPAIREALPACSQNKVRETRQENVVLRDIFGKLGSIPPGERKIPFQSGLGGIRPDELTAVEDNGVVTRQKDGYWVSEIYLHGLNFTYSNPGRRRVIAAKKS